MTVKELRKASGMTQQQFGDYFGIPKRTIQNWEAGVNKCPEYLLKLLKFRLDQKRMTENTEIVDGQCTKCGWFGDCIAMLDYHYCPGCGRKVSTKKERGGEGND